MINVLRFLLGFSKRKKLFFVSELSDLNSLDLELANNTIFGLDSEFDWRSTYLPKLSLIQISFADKLFIIDCLKLNPEKILKKYLESSKVLKIFHSARSDTTVLSKCLNIQQRIFLISKLETSFFQMVKLNLMGNLPIIIWGLI